ncbi:MAG: hypothetical protein F6K09_24240, partial [Merismopedia sp. SIO2A8]|nr:hypothetical protein [Merismopedia sp. SIO2A8]
SVPETFSLGQQYTLKISQSTGDGGGMEDHSDRSFTISNALDWFDLNLQTTPLQNAARSGFLDQSLGRFDMLNLFASVADDGIVKASELTDLQTIVAHHETLGIADHVRVLADNVVNGNNANTFYQGGHLGNLEVGSTGQRLNALVDKWFMGGDRPAAPEGYSMTYTYADGALFGNDNVPQLDDLRQGYLADCYFLAALGANAFHRPEVIRDMFIDNGDGTFTVKFYGQNNGKVTTEADYVTVDRWLPTHVSDGQYGGQQFAAFDNGDRGLWVALAEKAYAQFAESSISFRPVPINSYDGIQYGKGFRAMAAVSGNDGVIYTNLSSYGPAKVGDFPSFDTISQLFNGQTPMVVSTTSHAGLGLVSDHQYVVTSVNPSNQTLTLYNPHGTRTTPRPGETQQGFRTLSYADLATNFDTVEVQSI